MKSVRGDKGGEGGGAFFKREGRGSRVKGLCKTGWGGSEGLDPVLRSVRNYTSRLPFIDLITTLR